MQTTKIFNEQLDYDVDNELETQDDNDLMEQFFDYDGSTYICDAITEIADSSVSIWNATVLKEANGLHFSGAYEEAKANGLMEGSNDLMQNLQMAWYEYNSGQLYENLDTLVVNYALKLLDEKGIELDDEQIDELQDTLGNSIDNNSRFSDIEDAVKEWSEEQEMMMTVLLVKPFCKPEAVTIPKGLHSLQQAVGGSIEVVYPFEEEVGLVCNEEGKLEGLPLNRSLRDGNEDIYDTIAGDFLVVGLDEENFCSLSDEQMKQFKEHFNTPELFSFTDNGVESEPYSGDVDMEQDDGQELERD
jgi:hypothetical protein